MRIITLNTNPHAPDYSNPKNIAAPLGMARSQSEFLALFLVALFRVKTVNLAELATGFMGQAQQASHYKRLQRFVGGFEQSYATIAQFVVALMEIPQPWVLSVDRTTREFGDCVHNILMLGVVHNGVAFPLLWWMLDKKATPIPMNGLTYWRSSFRYFPMWRWNI